MGKKDQNLYILKHFQYFSNESIEMVVWKLKHHFELFAVLYIPLWLHSAFATPHLATDNQISISSGVWRQFAEFYGYFLKKTRKIWRNLIMFLT